MPAAQHRSPTSLTQAESALLNRAAQGLVPDSAAQDWFTALPHERQVVALHDLLHMAGQAHPVPTDLVAALQRTGLESTHTPAVLIARGKVAAIPTLPESERVRAFKLLLAWFAVADNRRQVSSCRGACSHWWHHLD